jgi:hypothetical protein
VELGWARWVARTLTTLGDPDENGKPTFVVNWINTTNNNDHVLEVLTKFVPE